MRRPNPSRKILYLDCASGVSGDMLLGALVDAGVDVKRLRAALAGLPLKGYTLTARRCTRRHIGARKVTVAVKGRHEHRGLREIRDILRRSDLPGDVRRAAMTIFGRIVRVEARIHGIPESRVHLHEVGAVDSIVDVVGCVVGLSELIGLPGTPGAGRIVCSPLNVGHGTVRTDHGVLPVPAPATAALLEGIPVYAEGEPMERVTPTGAAIVSTLAAAFGPTPPMVIERVGYGAGTRECEDRPNVVRALIGTATTGAEASHPEVMVLESTIDDMNPQTYGWVMDRLFAEGALEVFWTPVQMKKNRPGVLVTVIGPVDRLETLTRVLFEETTTIGLRYRPMRRMELQRETTRVRTRYGPVRVKISTMEGRPIQVKPEYDDCRRIAARRRIPLREVQRAAVAACGEIGNAPAGAAQPARRRRS